MNKYTSAINLSGTDRDKIVALEKYFPLLCKLYSNKEENKNKGIRFFTKPVTVLKEDITGFRKKTTKGNIGLWLLYFTVIFALVVF